MIAAAGAAMAQLSPPREGRRELSLSPSGSVSGRDGDPAAISDDVVTMRSPASTVSYYNSSPQQTPAAQCIRCSATDDGSRVASKTRGIWQGKPFRVVLRKTQAYGLGLHVNVKARVTAYRGWTARDAGVPIGATLISVGAVKLASLDASGTPVLIGGQQRLARELDRLQDFVSDMAEGQRVQAVFVVAAESLEAAVLEAPRSSFKSRTSDQRHKELRDAAYLRIHTEPGDSSDERTLHATPALLGPRYANLESKLCIMADPPLADDPAGILMNASIAYGRIVFVYRGEVPFVSKIRAAQRAGAAGVVVINSRDDPVLVDSHVVATMGHIETVDDGRECSGVKAVMASQLHLCAAFFPCLCSD